MPALRHCSNLLTVPSEIGKKEQMDSPASEVGVEKVDSNEDTSFFFNLDGDQLGLQNFGCKSLSEVFLGKKLDSRLEPD